MYRRLREQIEKVSHSARHKSVVDYSQPPSLYGQLVHASYACGTSFTSNGVERARPWLAAVTAGWKGRSLACMLVGSMRSTAYAPPRRCITFQLPSHFPQQIYVYHSSNSCVVCCWVCVCVYFFLYARHIDGAVGQVDTMRRIVAVKGYRKK